MDFKKKTTQKSNWSFAEEVPAIGHVWVDNDWARFPFGGIAKCTFFNSTIWWPVVSFKRFRSFWWPWTWRFLAMSGASKAASRRWKSYFSQIIIVQEKMALWNYLLPATTPQIKLTCPLKNSGWKTILSFWQGPFSGSDIRSSHLKRCHQPIFKIPMKKVQVVSLRGSVYPPSTLQTV